MSELDAWGETVKAFADGRPWLVQAALIVEVVLDPWSYRVAVAALLLLGWRTRRRRLSLTVGGALVLGGLAGVGLKELIARPRPSWQEVAAYAPGYSMPSGHALNAALGAGLLLILLWPALRTRRRRVVTVVIAVLLVAVTGADRIVLGVHYPTDVVAGWLLGAGIATAAWGLGRDRRQVRPESTPRHPSEDAGPGGPRGAA